MRLEAKVIQLTRWRETSGSLQDLNVYKN
jgi:hypothetical protein